MYHNEKEGKKLFQNIFSTLKHVQWDSNSQFQDQKPNVMKGSSILLQIVLISQRLGGPVDKDLCWGARGPEFNPSERLGNEKF